MERLLTKQYGFHSCSANELWGQAYRHVVPQMPVSQDFFEFGLREGHQFGREARTHCLTPLSVDEVIARRRGAVRAKYLKCRSLALDSPKRSEAYVHSFVKWELYADDGKPRAPRMIQFRSPAFNLRFAKYITKMEHKAYQCKPSWNQNLRWCAKGRNAVERGVDLTAMQLWTNTCFIEIDHSKFDSHVTTQHLRLSHAEYMAAYPRSKELKGLCRSQLHNTVFTGGHCLKVAGRRMSGDLDTGYGNSTINRKVLYYVFQELIDLRVCVLYLDGDDSVVAIHPDYRQRAAELLEQRLPATGFKSVYAFKDRLQDVEFCQAKVIITNGMPLLCRNPWRALSRLQYSTGRPVNEWMDYWSTIGMGESHASSGVPVIYPLARLLAGVGKVRKERLEYRHKVNLSIKCKEPDDMARATFAYAFDFPIALQRWLECCMSTKFDHVIEKCSEPTVGGRKPAKTSAQVAKAWITRTR